MHVPEPSRVRRQLGAELEAARTLAGINQRALAARLSVSQSLVSRAENGTRLLPRPVVQAWLRTTSARPDVRERVLALTEAAHVDRTWADQLADDRHLQDQERARETMAAVVRSFHPTVLPGLLQTADYVRHVIPLADISGRVDHTEALARRIVRQAVLREAGRRFDFLIAEHVLSWEPARGVLGPQLAQLAAALDLDAVRIGILPAGYAGAVPWHNFVITYPADGSPASVEAELIHGGQEVTDPESVGLYEALYDRMWEAAVTDEDAVRARLAQR